MAQAKDAIGNGLKVGDLVNVTIGLTQVRGRVSAIHEGGTILPANKIGQKEDMMLAGDVNVVMSYRAAFDPIGARAGICGELLKLVDPEPEEAERVRELAAEAKRTKGGLLLQ